MIDRETMDQIRKIPQRYEDTYQAARQAGFGHSLCKGLASDKIGEDAVAAIKLLLAEIDRREDDLR